MNKVFASILVLLFSVSAAVVIWPRQVIRPFRAQTESEVAVAYQLAGRAPAVTLVALLLGAATLAALWRPATSRWLKVPALAAVLALGGFTWAARVNVHQKIFAPMEEAGFVAALDAEYPPPEEMVLGISIDGEAKAYPVGILAYHHVVNDELAGVPLAVTY